MAIQSLPLTKALASLGRADSSPVRMCDVLPARKAGGTKPLQADDIRVSDKGS